MNNGITKHIACQLFAWGYELTDISRNSTYKIITVYEDCLFIGREKKDCFEIGFEDIGCIFFILARSTDKLCEEIEGKVPLEEICNDNGIDYEQYELTMKEAIRSLNDFYFTKYATDVLRFDKVLSIHHYLYSLHFAINLPEGTWKEI